MKVLVVEDEKQIASFIRKGLEARDFTVEVTHDGDDGYTRALTRPYEALVLDIMLEQLMRAPGRVFTRVPFWEQVWGYDCDPGTNRTADFPVGEAPLEPSASGGARLLPSQLGRGDDPARPEPRPTGFMDPMRVPRGVSAYHGR